jgi:DNA-binding transcriptional ArsR family regulator
VEALAAAALLAALGHESRLAIFRLLVEAGDAGMNASAIAEKVGLAAPTLSFHLAHLRRAGLIRKRQERRFLYYSANYAQMDELLAFLTTNCCQGGSCLPKTAAANPGRVARVPAGGIPVRRHGEPPKT